MDFGYKETDLFRFSSGNEGMSGSFGAHLGREREREAMGGESSDGRVRVLNALAPRAPEIQTIAVLVPMRSLELALKKKKKCVNVCVCVFQVLVVALGTFSLHCGTRHILLQYAKS